MAPTATAAAFLATPASSTPTGSSETSQTTPARWKTSATRCASGSECDAQTNPAPDSTISRAWAGPPTHAVRSAPKARSSATVGGVPSGGTSPFASDTTPAVSATPIRPSSSSASPMPFEGTARSRRSARRTSPSAPPIARTSSPRGRATPGRYWTFSPSARSRSACSAVRHTSDVRTPARSSSSATAVPKEPAPTTVARRGC